MFFFKPATVVVDFFTTESICAEINAPRKAVKDVPAWWSSIPKTVSPKEHLYPPLTMRKCPGFLDYFSSSVCVPMWCDFVVEVGPVGTTAYAYQFADGVSTAAVSGDHQRGGFLPSTNYQHLKLVNNWFAKTKRDLNWVITQPMWCSEEAPPVMLPPGVINFLQGQPLNANIFVQRLPDATNRVNIGAGTPLFFMTPMTDARVEFRFNRVNKDEFLALTQPRLFFTGNGIRLRRCNIQK